MMKQTTMLKTSAIATAVVAWCIACAPNIAHAQPNPFDAYEGKPTEAEAPVVEKKTPKPPPEDPNAFVKKGRWTLGLSNQLSLTSANNDVPNGEVSDSTVFVRVVPQAGYFLLDRVELGFGAGFMLRRFGRQDDEGSTSVDWLLETYGRYYLPMTDRLWFVPGVNIGVYTGSSTREFQLVQNDTVVPLNEETSTLGINAILNADVLYRVRENWGVRAGIALNAVWGREHIESQDTSYWGSTYHLGLGLGVVHHF